MSNYRPNSPQWIQPGQNFGPSYSSGQFQQPPSRSIEQVITLVKQLTLSSTERSEALHTLSLHREQIPELAILLWESPGTITSLLFEILAIYPHLASTSSTSNSPPPSLNSRLASRVCNVLALFQCVAGHDETRLPFIRANIPMYLFPFLHTTNTSRECECFKLTSLGILGSLVKAEQPDIIEYLLQNEFVPLCLRILKFGQEMSRIVAAFIVQKILSDPSGLSHVCTSSERLETVLKVLNIVLSDLSVNYSQRLAKNVVMSYENLLKTQEVKQVLPKMDMDKLSKVQFNPSCDDHFTQFVQKLLSYNTPKASQPKNH
ncbi:Cell differentiation protein RCD1 [Tritrichomonas musculus]|uniref:Cell differentiation protein RCD1 n=1 Tax=Tritrichomonas musculus TaxID=1915356 RepID=A0ABR2K7T1_9EUKA